MITVTFKLIRHFFPRLEGVYSKQPISDKYYGSKKIYGRSGLKNLFMGAVEGILTGEMSLKKYYDRLRSEGLNHDVLPIHFIDK
jgi:hypothetical protein